MKTVFGLAAVVLLVVGLFMGTAAATLQASAGAGVGVSGANGGFCFFHASANSSASADHTDIGFTIQATYAIMMNGIVLSDGSETQAWPSTDMFVSTGGSASGNVKDGWKVTAKAEGTGSSWVSAPAFDAMADAGTCGVASTDVDDYRNILGEDVCQLSVRIVTSAVDYHSQGRAHTDVSCS